MISRSAAGLAASVLMAGPLACALIPPRTAITRPKLFRCTAHHAKAMTRLSSAKMKPEWIVPIGPANLGEFAGPIGRKATWSQSFYTVSRGETTQRVGGTRSLRSHSVLRSDERHD